MAKLRFRKKEVLEIPADTFITAGEVVADSSAGKTSKARQWLVCALNRHVKRFIKDDDKVEKAVWELLQRADVHIKIVNG